MRAKQQQYVQNTPVENVPLQGRTAPCGGVLVEQGHSAEGAGAGVALVLLYVGVGLHVGAQVGTVSEGPAAVLTSKGTFTCMCPDVSSEQPWPGESLAAGWADTGKRVRADVHL